MPPTDSPRLSPPYYLGCPVWSHKEWIGPVFPKGTSTQGLLRPYSKFFNTVEGGSLFYALPPMATVERWMAEAGPEFRFAMKFPKAISHERRLMAAHNETNAFLKILEALRDGGRIGPSFLQLPPSFNINSIDVLEAYLKNLPTDFKYAVEFRHISFFDNGDNEKKADDLLANLGVNKVVFDSRPLFSTDPQGKTETDAQNRKPNLPVRPIATSSLPFVRFVARNDIESNQPWIKEWVAVVNKWILEGKKPYVFVHAPDETNAPIVARLFNDQLRRINPLVPDLPPFASEFASPEEHPTSEQLDLF